MIRFIRAVIYSIAAAMAASFFLDWLDRTANTARRHKDEMKEENAIDKLGNDEKEALLDELAAKV